MNKFAVLAIAGMVFVSGCSTISKISGNDKSKSEKLAEESKEICKKLGFEEGSLAFRDCTVAQFNRTSGQYIGVNPQ